MLKSLAIVLMHELLHQNREASRAEAISRGSLAAWQKRKVASYIEEHLTEQISLTKMAELARLSPYHFCRAFKQSFGTPPHRYHIGRRVERAKLLLSHRSKSITEIGLDLGFSETSAFTSTFRKATGLTPRGSVGALSDFPEGAIGPSLSSNSSRRRIGMMIQLI